jgi:hypothetical protein
MNSDCIPPITITIIIVWASAARRNEGSCHPENVPQGRNLDLPTTRKTEKVGEKNPRMYARTSPFFWSKTIGFTLIISPTAARSDQTIRRTANEICLRVFPVWGIRRLSDLVGTFLPPEISIRMRGKWRGFGGIQIAVLKTDKKGGRRRKAKKEAESA